MKKFRLPIIVAVFLAVLVLLAYVFREKDVFYGLKEGDAIKGWITFDGGERFRLREGRILYMDSEIIEIEARVSEGRIGNLKIKRNEVVAFDEGRYPVLQKVQ